MSESIKVWLLLLARILQRKLHECLDLFATVGASPTLHSTRWELGQGGHVGEDGGPPLLQDPRDYHLRASLNRVQARSYRNVHVCCMYRVVHASLQSLRAYSTYECTWYSVHVVVKPSLSSIICSTNRQQSQVFRMSCQACPEHPNIGGDGDGDGNGGGGGGGGGDGDDDGHC